MTVSPYTLFAAGRSYLEALKIVRQSPDFPPREYFMVLPCCTLAGFVIELELKAYLLHKGAVQEAKLRSHYGHDLGKLLRDAKANGLNVPGLDHVLAVVESGHGDFSYRYLPEGHTYSLLRGDHVTALDALDNFVAVAVDAVAEAERRRKKP